MANIFKSVTFADVNNSQEFFSVPVGSTVTVIGLTLANSAINTDLVRGNVYVDKRVGDTVDIVRSVIIPVGSTLVVVGGDQKLVLESEDMIYFKTINPSQYIDVMMSYMETT